MNIFKQLFKKSDDITSLKSMERLEIKDGDILIFTYPKMLHPDTIERLKVEVDGIMLKAGISIHVIVLEDGMKIGAIGKEKAING